MAIVPAERIVTKKELTLGGFTLYRIPLHTWISMKLALLSLLPDEKAEAQRGYRTSPKVTEFMHDKARILMQVIPSCCTIIIVSYNVSTAPVLGNTNTISL